jgi:hypothetical protein
MLILNCELKLSVSVKIKLLDTPINSSEKYLGKKFICYLLNFDLCTISVTSGSELSTIQIYRNSTQKLLYL